MVHMNLKSASTDVETGRFRQRIWCSQGSKNSPWPAMICLVDRFSSYALLSPEFVVCYQARLQLCHWLECLPGYLHLKRIIFLRLPHKLSPMTRAVKVKHYWRSLNRLLCDLEWMPNHLCHVGIFRWTLQAYNCIQDKALWYLLTNSWPQSLTVSSWKNVF